MSHKTNAVRLLDTAKVNYELREYEVDDHDVSAEHVALSLGLIPEILYKTLVLKGNIDPYIVAVIPGNAQLDLKKIAKASGNKNCEMLPMKDLLAVTGYIRGGCSPIGMKKLFPTFIEEAAQLETEISVSAGKRGLQMILNPNDLATMTKAIWSDLISI
ncbi:Cys-tRNA(Pro) deacylase [Sphingobacterium detergens]|uniref:Cys-tRNA(Pro)/Cys-tRNA(Cys) deacylase n=1 Tax=Sphingobacterium detergens TaxID=1145106 RepID=A0A420AQQ6_SPHD1|nr:Cys-tRNA(Pro) deacylase [Sphingobacterium detergens]RKE46814.1 Cys-tRNA(Pro)/Cys-tRNA(Cys) deacylase [Sphingobacterium detergens]